jgi:hypothetical protein
MTDRPATLREVAARAETLADFGRELADWLHTLRAITSRPALAAIIAQEPPLLAARFPEGAVADAYLAACAEHLAATHGLDLPDWARAAARIAPEPWFAHESGHARLRAQRDTPPAIKRRNLFTLTPDFPVRLRSGRPAVSLAARRASNAARQRRFRRRHAKNAKPLSGFG